MAIEEQSRVKIHYKLSLESGEVLEDTSGQEPLEFVFGAGQIIPRLEQELSGMEKGEQKKVTLEAEDAYGERDPKALVTIPREEFPAEGPIEPGMMFRLNREDGMVMHVTVAELSDNDVTLDLNHPLAGEKLHFELTLEEVSPPAG
jgi:FKBP-type peptidyl-prolyl cis-trans isomerase 2